MKILERLQTIVGHLSDRMVDRPGKFLVVAFVTEWSDYKFY
jgi:hypothetical protein